MLVQSAAVSDVTNDVGAVTAPSPQAYGKPRRLAPDSVNHRVSDPAVVRAARRANCSNKRGFDFCVSLGGLIVLAPLLRRRAS